MTRSEKKLKRILRAEYRRKQRMERYVYRINRARDIGLPVYVPLSAAGNGIAWVDPNSETGYSMVCEYFDICSFPCNGDC